jgi:hypothetical protein
MPWTHPFVERLRRARMVARSWASMHYRGVSPIAQKMSVFGINMASLCCISLVLHVVTRFSHLTSKHDLVG